MRIQPNTDHVSIVLLGAFNPKIFHPAWLALHDLISQEAAVDAVVEVVIPELSKFQAGYITFEIQPKRFLVKCETAHKDLVKDLTLSVFADHLPHTLVWQFGINREISFSCGSEAARDKLGTLLAPKMPWGNWGAKLSQRDSGLHGGMIRLVMRQVPRPDDLEGHIQAEIQPVADDRTAVWIQTNDHFAVSDPEKTIGCLEAMDLIGAKWQDAMETAEYIVDGVMATTQENR